MKKINCKCDEGLHDGERIDCVCICHKEEKDEK